MKRNCSSAVMANGDGVAVVEEAAPASYEGSLVARCRASVGKPIGPAEHWQDRSKEAVVGTVVAAACFDKRKDKTAEPK